MNRITVIDRKRQKERNRYGIGKKACKWHEGYFTRRNADSGLRDECDQRDLPQLWIYTDRNSLYGKYRKSKQ